MKAKWTKWAEEKLLPFPGDPRDTWTVDVNAKSLKKSEANIAKGGGGAVPAKPTIKAEVKRGIDLRLNEVYGEKGNHPRDTFGRDLVDVWCARAGVAFATEVLVAITDEPQREEAHRPGHRPPYRLRRDGQPWARLREHLAACSADERKQAHAIAKDARDAKHEARQAVAYAFCDAAWVAADIKDGALKKGYGQLALLASLENAQQGRDALALLMSNAVPKYQLIEEAPAHIPNLMKVLDDDDAPLIIEAAKRAWNAASRKPWLEIVACIDSAEARAFIQEHS